MLRDYLPRSLLGRSLLIVVTPLIVLQVVSAYIFYESHWDQVSKSLALGLAGDIAMVIDMLRQDPSLEGHQRVLEAAERTMDIAVTLKPGEILRNRLSVLSSLEGEIKRALRHRVGKPAQVDAHTNGNAVLVYVQLPEGVLSVIVPRSRLFSATIYVFVLWTVGGTLILLGIATMFMRSQVRPVLRLARAADNFGKGRDVPNFKPEGAREVRLAARAFIAMRARILRQIAQRTEMLAGVSHDLRTPLTRMKLELAMMKSSDGVAELKDDVAEMERMLEGYLEFARGEGAETPEPHDVVWLLDEAVRKARRISDGVQLKAEGTFVVPLRPNAFRRCINNLIGNATRYARHVVVDAGKRGRSIEIIIDDDGPGIPEPQRDDVFKPFFRLEGSRNPGTGGVGLGMTIARDVARSHGGEIKLADSPMGGLRVRLRLPL